ncbi:MAG: NAD(+)/NADH kinase [Gammaproteobacteria bacterium]|jgi:diacylglycerol kinase family enzyme|nr:NAD(+)/NADH kinase [Gammaproteobacteria bacterium]MBU0772779.1 NAD(+)/NADH kinase [Gammaproteobacteria bacterium]MBU0855707.1 NAD(+)/NADH kinase [Gammaproteobacteria bacterium]MBU1847024.1 NAD(+)/NADH kinase [Gammaproteobacteria bacterium]
MTDPTPFADAPLFIVLNAGSGKRDAAQASATISRVLHDAGRAHTILQVCNAKHLADTARDAVEHAQAQRGIVVAAGGDGTINAVTQAVLGSGCPFGVLPQGTFNYFSREHGIPSDTEAATRLLLTGRIKPVQVGRVNDRVFLVNASIGLYPEVLEDREEWKRQLGRKRIVALFSGLATLLRGCRRMTLEIEHEGRTRTQDMMTLFVGNNPLQLAQVGLHEDGSAGNGRLAAVMLPPTGRLVLLWLMARGMLGRLGDADAVQRFDFRSLCLHPGRSRRKVKVATDGEIRRMALPLRFDVAPQPLPLIVPDDTA